MVEMDFIVATNVGYDMAETLVRRKALVLTDEEVRFLIIPFGMDLKTVELDAKIAGSIALDVAEQIAGFDSKDA